MGRAITIRCVASVAMTYFVPVSGHHGSNVHQRCAHARNAGAFGEDLGACSGTSDATGMVGEVLLLVPVTIILVLVMVWWLT
jgi:hypothetical protein